MANLFNIVLFAPEIPQNTGNIGRICVCSGCRLHLVKPLAFSLDDKYVRRAGMDYWHHVELAVHEDWDSILQSAAGAPMHFLSTKGGSNFWDCPMEDGCWMVFGNESSGLPAHIHESFRDSFYTIPMPGVFNRSLNVANSVAVVVYEGLRRRMGA